jgi:hypothetical protein
MEVVWRWICWFSFWSLLTVFVAYELPYRLPQKTRLAMCATLIFLFPLLFHGTAVHQWRAEQADKVEGDLLGGSEFSYDDPRLKWPVILQVGVSGPKITWGTSNAGIKWFEDAGLKLEAGKRGPIITTPIRDRNGNLVVSVESNHWRIYPEFCSEKNYTTDSLGTC